MEELTPTGLSRDGKRLVLVDARGAEYSVPVDASLRRALQGDRTRHGQLEMKMESTLRPRDIQARIRAGESAEEVAAAAQTTVERIMGFAGPVLAERAHVAQSAQASSVRRKNADTTSGRTLGEAAALRLRELGLHDEDVAWDAWRREDGRWTLVADYRDEGSTRHAEFSYDVRGRYVVADNDDARLLTGEARPKSASAAPRSGRRLAAVPDQDELPLGDDALELVSDIDRVSSPEGTDQDVPERSGEDPVGELAWEDSPETGDVDGRATDRATERSTDRATDGGTDETSDEAAAPPPTAPETEPDDRPEVDHASADDEETTEVPVRRRRRKGRASVPSWDEIMFGGGGSKSE